MGKIKDFDIEECGTITHEELLDSLEEYSKRWYVALTDRAFPNGIAGYRAWHTLTHPWKIIEFCIVQTKWAFQRVFRGWDDRAIWSIDWYLAKLIPQLMRELAKITHGTPAEMYPEDSAEREITQEEDDEAIKKWHDILEKIAVGFDIYHENQHEVYYKEEFKKPFEEAFDLFRKYFGGFWD